MWNPNLVPINSQEDDDSWDEVKAFADDTGNVMGTTWPPRSYTCTFCRREFRSAQALGGHMNVHRRDRARLHQAQSNLKNPNLSSSSALLINPTTQELVANGGLCLFYTLPTPNAIINPSSLSNVKAMAHHTFNSSLSNSSNTTEASMSTTYKGNQKLVSLDDINQKKTDSTIDQGIDLELRLGFSSSAS